MIYILTKSGKFMSAVFNVWGKSLEAIEARKTVALAVSADVTATVIEAFLEVEDSDEVSALDLYEVIIRDQQNKLESLSVINQTYATKANQFALARADYESKIAALTSSRDQLANELAEQGVSGASSASLDEVRRLLANEVTKTNELKAALLVADNSIAELVGQNDALKADIQAFAEDVDAIKGERSELLTKLEHEQGESQVLRNRILTIEANARETAKASDRTIRALEAKVASLTRSLDVANKEVGKEKERRAEMHKGNVAAIEAMRTAKKNLMEMEAEVAELRMVRRYLVMMMDCALHENFFESESGYCNVLTYNTHKISSPEDNFVIDEEFPVGFWINKNGFACILGVSTADENGERSLVMPANDKVSKRAQDAICPSKADQTEILNSLMKFNAPACQESFQRSRDKISQLAIYAEHQENLTLENKNLIAITKRAVAGGRTSVPNAKTHSAKRAPKRRK